MDSPGQDFDFLTVSETAELLHLKTATVRSWVLHRKIPYLKLGRRIFLQRQDLQALRSASVVPALSPDQLRAESERRKARTSARKAAKAERGTSCR